MYDLDNLAEEDTENYSAMCSLNGMVFVLVCGIGVGVLLG
jgi:hypothetical protein